MGCSSHACTHSWAATNFQLLRPPAAPRHGAITVPTPRTPAPAQPMQRKLQCMARSGSGSEVDGGAGPRRQPSTPPPPPPPQDRQHVPSCSRSSAHRTAYLLAAIVSTGGITFLTAAAVYYRFAWQTLGAAAVPLSEMLGTFALAVGAAVGMEFWARWAHRALWHDSLWSMHESHHRPRQGPFETNDIFAIINAVPAIALISYGFFHKGFVPGLCFGAGLGITMFGIAYMFVHDGLVHRRFPVGPIADVPYLQKVAAAHQLHHTHKFRGVPYGLFLGPKELEDERGGATELQRMIRTRKGKATSGRV